MPWNKRHFKSICVNNGCGHYKNCLVIKYQSDPKMVHFCQLCTLACKSEIRIATMIHDMSHDREEWMKNANLITQ